MYPEGHRFAQRFYPTDLPGSGNYHRAEFLSLLVSLLPERVQKESVHFGKRIIRYEQQPNGPVTMYFADGTSAVCDVLIGADGIKSPTRYRLFADRAALESDEVEKARLMKYAVPRWSGMVAYRGLVRASDAQAVLGREHRCSKDRVMVSKNEKSHMISFS